MKNSIKNIAYWPPLNWVLCHILRAIGGYRLPVNFTIRYDKDLKLYSNPTSALCKRIFHDRGFEYTDIAKRLFEMPDVRTFLDVGANIGYYSFLASKRGVDVYAFEPNTEIRDWFIDCRRLNKPNLKKDIMILSSPLSNKDFEKVVFKDVKNKRFPNVPSLSGISGFYAEGEEVELFTETVDGFCSHNLIVPDVIKIDVEGADPLVLQGAQDTMVKHRPIIIVEYKRNREDILKAFQGKRYKTYGFLNGRLVRYISGMSSVGIDDMFFIPSEKEYIVDILNGDKSL